LLKKYLLIDDGPVKSLYDTHVCHSRESGNPLFQILTSSWIPAFAGMTTICEAIIDVKIKSFASTNKVMHHHTFLSFIYRY